MDEVLDAVTGDSLDRQPLSHPGVLPGLSHRVHAHPLAGPSQAVGPGTSKDEALHFELQASQRLLTDILCPSVLGSPR